MVIAPKATLSVAIGLLRKAKERKQMYEMIRLVIVPPTTIRVEGGLLH